MTTQKPKQRLMKTTKICKTKPNETKAWFRSPFTPCGRETDQACSTAAGARAGPTVEDTTISDTKIYYYLQ